MTDYTKVNIVDISSLKGFYNLKYLKYFVKITIVNYFLIIIK